MNLGELQRAYLVIYRRIKSPTKRRSFSYPVNSFCDDLPAGRVKPVIIGSMKTISVLSSHELGLSTYLYGGGNVFPSSVIKTILGPRAPICNQTEEEPGPPLKEKRIGRLEGSVSPSFV